MNRRTETCIICHETNVYQYAVGNSRGHILVPYSFGINQRICVYHLIHTTTVNSWNAISPYCSVQWLMLILHYSEPVLQKGGVASGKVRVKPVECGFSECVKFQARYMLLEVCSYFLSTWNGITHMLLDENTAVCLSASCWPGCKWLHSLVYVLCTFMSKGSAYKGDNYGLSTYLSFHVL
jgi:hypothetical protein